MRTVSQNEFGGSRRRQKGQAAVEFALTMTFLILLILSIMELFIFIYTYSVLADAAKEGVRYAIVHGTNSSSANGPSSGTASSPPCTSANATTGSSVSGVTTQVRNFGALSLHNSANINVNVCYLDGNNKLNSLVEVSVNYLYQPFFGLGWPTVRVNANSAGRIVF